MKFRAASVVLTALAIVSGASCSSSSSDNTATGPVGGAVTGPQDDHCAGQPDGVSDPATCSGADTAAAGAADEAAGGAPNSDITPAAAGEGPTASGGASGTPDCNLAHDADYGDTMFNASGVDDDCKYDVSWTSTPIRKGESVTFTVTAASKSSGAPLERIAAQQAGAVALSRVEPYIPCEPTHVPPAADLRAPIKETAPGVFSVGPIVFDKSARWVVRFHFYENCVDSDTSPHGHAAFFVDVP
ncbi:MAG TPA: hypothetical protein VIK01_14025 [Polyangiaceae bacterium]